MNLVNLIKWSPAPDASIVCEDPKGLLSVKIEQQTLMQLASELNSGSSKSLSGVLLGMVLLVDDRTRVEIGACPLLKSGSLHLPGDSRDEAALEAELKNYPRASPRAPGCVGYFCVGSVGQHGPTKEEQELFFRRFTGPSQVFLFARRSETGRLTPQFFAGPDGHLVPLSMPVSTRGAVNPSKRRFQWVAAALVVAIAGALMSAYRDRTRVETGNPDRFTITPQVPELKPLQLTVSREANALTLHWDPDAAAIRSARAGLLEIEDGERKAQQTLDPVDLRNGKLVYVPSNSNVRFRMDLLTPTGAVETTSIRVLGLEPRSSPRLAVASPPQAEAIRSRVDTPSNTPPPPKEPPKSVPAQPPPAGDTRGDTRMVEVASKPQAAAPAPASVAVAETKPLAPPVAEPQANLTVPERSEPPVAARQPEIRTTPPVSPVETPAKVSISQRTQEPRVKRQTKPSIPLGLQSMLRSRSRNPITIPVKVRIDPLGEVTSAQADHSNSSVLETQLANIAATTARYWTFYPATINDKPVSSELVINFKF